MDEIVAILDDEDMARLRRAAHEEIARRAYALFLARGAAPGRDVEDWLRAERELAREE